MAREAEAKYRIVAEDKTRRGLQSAQRGLSRFKGAAAGFVAAFARPMAGAAAALGAAGIALNAVADKLNNLNRAGMDVGLTGEQIAELGHIARESDVDIGQLTGGIEQLQEKIQDAKQGGEEARRQFLNLGVSFRDLEGKTPVEQLVLLDEAFEKIEDRSKRIAGISELLGGGFGRLFGDPDSVARMREVAEEIGLLEGAAGRLAAGTAFTKARNRLTAALGARAERFAQPFLGLGANLMNRGARNVGQGGQLAAPAVLPGVMQIGFQVLRELKGMRADQRKRGSAVYSE